MTTEDAMAETNTRFRIPPGATRIEVGWAHEDEDYRVLGYLTPGRAERGPSYSCAGEPAEPAEFCPLAVTEDRPGGKERPELLAAAERDLDDLTMRAEAEVLDRALAALEDRDDEERERRHSVDAIERLFGIEGD